MGIEDIQISEELETNAPSIKYSGNEGPKSPQDEQRMKMAQLEEVYSQYVEEMIEQGIEPMSMQQFIEQAMAEGQMSSAQPMAPQGMPPRQMAARGGIMGADGRTGFLFGGIKKRIRKLIPNEIAEVAEKAAPFIALAAPQFALPAAIAGGLGSFDRTGKVGSSLLSGLKTYGLGQISPGLPGLRNVGPSTGMFSKTGAMGGKYNLSNIMAARQMKPAVVNGPGDTVAGMATGGGEGIETLAGQVQEAPLTDAAITKLNSASVTKPNLLETVLSKANEFVPKSFGALNPFGENFSGKQFTGALFGLEMARRLFGEGANPDDDINEIMKRGEGLDIAGIRAEVMEAYRDPSGKKLKALAGKYPFLGNASEKQLAANGGRIGFAEGGGIMDLGGMEKDYRAEGGFVPIGKAEKADDVPARLSVNEFVFTADAVRNAGGGDIDRGAEVMENMMKNLEAGGQVSEESQGMAGAQQMFETSQRLSEVI